MATPNITPGHIIWTYSDLQLFHDDLRREVIDGDLIVSPSPATSHQRSSKRLQRKLTEQLEDPGFGVVFYAPLDVIVSATTVIVPDLIVVLRARQNIITERGVEGAPDLVVEILSPSNIKNDRDLKFKLYAKVGVPEYWIADPAAHAIEVYRLGKDGYDAPAVYGPGTRLVSATLPVQIDVDPIFAP